MATTAAERATGVPDQLLTAISRVESGRVDPESGRLEAWPWTIDVEGTGHFYETKDAAMAAVASFQARGARSIDVGCLQINLKQHPEAFASLQEAFDPTANAMFAARFLTSLFGLTGSWPHAAAAYHSQTPEVGHDYQNQVLAMWAVGDGPAARRGQENAAPATHSPAPGSLFAGGGVAAPFGTPTTFSVTRYDPRSATVAAGRSLSDYRGRPIAIASRLVLAQKY